MKDLLKQYFSMKDEDKTKLKELFIINEFENRLKTFNNINITLADEEIIFDIINDISKECNLKIETIITRILEILNGQDVSIDDFLELEDDELIELISDKNDSIEVVEKEAPAFSSCNLIYMFIKEINKYLLIFEKNNIYKSLLLDTPQELEEYLKTI